MGRIRNVIAAVKKAKDMAIKYDDESYVDFNRNRLLYMSRVYLELFEKYCGGLDNDEFKFGTFQRALNGEFNDYWGVHLDAGEVERFAREWREEDLYKRVLARDKSTFEGYSTDFAAWLSKLLQTVAIYSDTGYIRFALFDNEFKSRIASWSGWKHDGVSWTED